MVPSRESGSSSDQTKGHHDSKDSHKSKGLSERERQRRAELIARAKERREALVRQIRHEKLAMLCSSCIAIISSFIWIIAVSTDHWYLVDGDVDADTSNQSFTNGKIFVSSNTGLWRGCRILKSNTSEESSCQYHYFFPSSEEIAITPGLDEHVVDYTRTEVCFAIISLLLMVMALISAFYTFKNSRYMYKRLAAGLYFITSVSVLVVLEVLVTSVRYEQLNVPYNHPPNSVLSYGFSFYLGWSVFLVYLVNGCIFLVLSRKRKGDKGLGEDADEAQIMGR